MLMQVFWIILGIPFFIMGQITSFIWNSFMGGYCYIDNRFHPNLYKAMEINNQIKGKE